MEKNRDALGLGNALKDSMLLWLLVPIFIPSVSCVVFSVYCTVTGNTRDMGLGNIDFINSILVLLVVLFLVLIVLGDKLAWLFFRKNVPHGQPADPARRILMLRDRLAQSAQLVRDSESAENWFAAEKEKFQRKKDFGSIMDQCVGSIEKLGGAQFRINHYALCERCRIPASKERITIDFELVEELLAGLQDVLSKISWQRCVMIQKIYHDPNLLKPFQDMCDLFESMADRRDKDSQNATNDNHPEQFSDNYTDEKRASALAARFVDGLAETWERKCAAGFEEPLKAIFVGCGWKKLVSGVIGGASGRGISIEWSFADVEPGFAGRTDEFPVDGDKNRMHELEPPFSGERSLFAKMETRFDAVLYAHCLQHKAMSCKDQVFEAMLRCVKPNGVAMLAMATSPDPELDGCAVEGLASYETLELFERDREVFDQAFRANRAEFHWDVEVRKTLERCVVRQEGRGIWIVENRHQNKGHVLKIGDKYLFYRHREADNAKDGRLLWTFVVNDPISDSLRSKAFLECAKWKLKNLGASSPPETAAVGESLVFVHAAGMGILLVAAKVFRSGTGTPPQKRDADRFFCFLCSKLDSASGKGVPVVEDNVNVSVGSVCPEFTESSHVAVLAKGVDETGLQLVFVRPKDSMHPTKEHMLFVFEPGGVWRTFLPKTCQFPLSLFEKKPAEWLARCAKEFKPFKITAAFDPPTITRRMSHPTREKIFGNAGYGEIREYYHQILATIPKGTAFPGVPDDCDLSGESAVERDVRFNALPIDTRLRLLDVLNVQDVLVWGIRSDGSFQTPDPKKAGKP